MERKNNKNNKINPNRRDFRYENCLVIMCYVILSNIRSTTYDIKICVSTKTSDKFLYPLRVLCDISFMSNVCRI